MLSLEGYDSVAYIAVAIIALVVYYVVSLMSKQNSNSKVKKMPGGIWKSIQAMTNRDAPSIMIEQFKDAGGDPIYRMNLPIPGGFHVLADAEMQKQILYDPGSDKPTIFYDNLTKVTGHLSIFTYKTSHPRWKHLRKGSALAFSSSEVSRMNRIAAKHVDQWMETVLDTIVDKPDGSFDPCSEMTKVTFRVILEAGFEYLPTDQEFDSFVSNLSEILIEIGMKQPLNPLRRVFAFMIPEARQAMACCGKLREFAYTILRAYRANSSKSESKTLIKLIENNPYDLSDAEKMTEILTYMVAGYDTTGHTLGNTLALLAKHQDIQTKVIESLPKNATVPSDYLARVLQESKRYMPVAAMGSLRTVSREFDFGNGIILPKGTNVLMPQILPHHDAKVFDRPDEFLPERWENATESMLGSMMSFAHGARNCIGQSLAQTELNSVLPVLLSKYRFEIADEGKPDFFVTFKFAGAKLKASKA